MSMMISTIFMLIHVFYQFGHRDNLKQLRVTVVTCSSLGWKSLARTLLAVHSLQMMHQIFIIIPTTILTDTTYRSIISVSDETTLNGNLQRQHPLLNSAVFIHTFANNCTDFHRAVWRCLKKRCCCECWNTLLCSEDPAALQLRADNTCAKVDKLVWRLQTCFFFCNNNLFLIIKWGLKRAIDFLLQPSFLSTLSNSLLQK